MSEIFNISLIAAGIRMSTPLIFAAFGGMYSERGGTWNLALEGLMLFGAFSAAAVAYATQNLFLGVLAGIAAGMIASMLHAAVTLFFRGDQIISGIAINILALGIPALISESIWQTSSSTPAVGKSIATVQIPLIHDFPVLGVLISGYSILVYLAFLIAILTTFVFSSTRFGLRLSASGEHPQACEASGINVQFYRFKGILISGILAGLGGVYLSIGHGTSFIKNMTAGRGFIAVAALILGNWKPRRTLAACLIFGFAEAIQIRFQGEIAIPVEFIHMIPYILVIILLTGIIGKVSPPKAGGKPFFRE